MALKYRLFTNRKTGQVYYADAGRLGNFKNSIKKLVNYIRYNMPRYYIAHVTLTVAENRSELDCSHLHRVTQFISQRLKRAGSDFKYIAVKELQERGAIHFHLLCVYNKAYVFPCKAEIESSWGLGFIKITAPKLRMKLQKIVGYIGKYIGKGYDYESLDVKKSFSASQIRQIYKLNSDRLAAVIGKFGIPVSECFQCTYTKVYGTLSNVPGYRYLVMEFQSDWVYGGQWKDPF